MFVTVVDRTTADRNSKFRNKNENNPLTIPDDGRLGFCFYIGGSVPACCYAIMDL